MQAITRNDLKRMNESEHDDFVLINVLSPDAFNQAHIRTSVNVPVDQEGFEEMVKAIAASRDRHIVVYCASFDCDASRQAAEQLDAAGFKHVYDYEGGTKDWIEKRMAA
ncbi:rhodanese-like domain-containing protein [Gilvimarinus algae]|uniref:Rhodanese-like domain-containing protein n=1 Tax=Gilvimarinus algae TaxID=3058037 RepID=A0ABT8TE60_9GAMM|nr:rhodanese-like domain-containing protein [Gilvimarinus sp. SDUM040014]MDO3380951.1 rhodanese-like domain-containing protein [Gilvimarinus sp. SDUM040014]